MEMVGIFDYGSGNFTSVWNAFSAITDKLCAIKAPDRIKDCSHLVLPGVGTFDSTMTNLKSLGLVEPLIKALTEDRKQYLGICVGMQILADFGLECCRTDGLGVIKGFVEKIAIDTDRFLLPHIGWNDLTDMQNSPLLEGIDSDATFYFAHSYCLTLNEPLPAVKTDYGILINSVVSTKNIHGVQFHPEKSQYYGLKLLSNFLRL